ncbi:MAG: hypothetical protein JW918_02065 [Anaerolineae bacterium]|nr:hypothetical protein [Anaerolineae bacterium]
MEKRYAALRTIGTIYKVLGIAVAAITLLLIIGICLFTFLGGMGGVAMSRGADEAALGLFGTLLGSILVTLFSGIVMIIYGGSIALTLYAMGEGIYLMLALEENTRMMVMALQGRSG